MTRRPETEILETVYRRSAQIRLRRRMLQISIGLVALVLVLTTSPALVRQLAFQEVDSADQPGVEDPRKVGTEQGDIEETEVGPGSDGPPAPGSSSGGQGSSSKRGSGSGSPEGTISQDPEPAGPPVYYTDQADDAYGQDGGPPNAALSQREFDILRVDWGPVAYVNEKSPGGYSTSMTIAGPAKDWDDNAMYVSWGQFGRDCRLYHFLVPGTTAYANAFCDSYSGPWGFVGRVEGGPVTSTTTQSGGTLLSATFDNRAIPSQLEWARTLYGLSAWTCTGRIDEPLNACDAYLDWARSFLSYRV